MAWDEFWAKQGKEKNSPFHMGIWALRKSLSSDYAKFFSKNIGFKPRKILEVGCGTGTTLNYLKAIFPDAECFGVDKSKEALSIATDMYPECRFKLGDAFSLSRYKNFDLAYSVGLVEHFSRKDAKKIMMQKEQTLSGNGALGLVVPIKFGFVDFARMAMGKNWPYGEEHPFALSEIPMLTKKVKMNRQVHYFSIYQCIWQGGR